MKRLALKGARAYEFRKFGTSVATIDNYYQIGVINLELAMEGLLQIMNLFSEHLKDVGGDLEVVLYSKSIDPLIMEFLTRKLTLTKTVIRIDETDFSFPSSKKEEIVETRYRPNPVF